MREWLIQKPGGLKSDFEVFFNQIDPAEKQVIIDGSDLPAIVMILIYFEIEIRR
jgi:hypothetical protein